MTVERFCSRPEGHGFEIKILGHSLIFWSRSVTGNGYYELWLFGRQAR